MNYLSFDVGIKNLAYCLVCFDDLNIGAIEDWAILNVDETKQKKQIFYCQDHMKKTGLNCQKKATKYNIETLKPYCTVHAKKYQLDLIKDINKIKCHHLLKNDKVCDKNVTYLDSSGLRGFCSVHYQTWQKQLQRPRPPGLCKGAKSRQCDLVGRPSMIFLQISLYGPFG